jgi:hypothetical protein
MSNGTLCGCHLYKISDPDVASVCQVDRIFYSKAYDIRATGMDPVTHYNRVGRSMDRLPNSRAFRFLYPLLDLVVYRSRNSDLSHFSDEELMAHYHHRGRYEGRAG